MNMNTPAVPSTPRHKWLKVRLHTYICRQCGMGRVNAQRPNTGDWFTTFHRPDGEREIALHVPACERGSYTDAYLKRYESALACAAPRGATSDQSQANA